MKIKLPNYYFKFEFSKTTLFTFHLFEFTINLFMERADSEEADFITVDLLLENSDV